MTLGEIFDIARGGSPRPIQDFLTDDPDGVNWIMIGDASSSAKHIRMTKKRILPAGVKRSRMVYPGDFLLTNSMSFGRPYIMDVSGCIHDGWLVLSPKGGNFDPDFFYHLLGSPVVYHQFQRLAGGAVVKNLNIELVTGVEIPVPPLAEQRRIAAILDKADALRLKARRAIDLTEDLVRSTFLEMFGDPVTNPKGWPLVKGQQLFGDLTYGTNVKCSDIETEGSLPVLRIPNIVGGEVSWDDLKFGVLSPREVDELRLLPGDLVFVRTNGNPDYIARCAVYNSDRVAMYASYLIRARIGESTNVLPEFIKWQMSLPSYRCRIQRECKTTAGNYNISGTGLRKLPLILPPKSVQEEFLRVAARVARIREDLLSSLYESNICFDGLLQRAFSGEV